MFRPRGASEVRAVKVTGLVKGRLAEVGVGENRGGELRVGEVRTAERGLAEVRVGKVGTDQDRLVEVNRPASDIMLDIPAPDHCDGGLDVGPCPSSP